MTSPASTQNSGKNGRAPSDATGVEPVRSTAPTGSAGNLPAQLPEQSLESSQTRERIVVAMMGLVATAVGGVAHAHLGYSIAGSATAGLIAFAVFMALNGLLVRAAEIARLRAEVARLEHEMARIKTQGAMAVSPGRQGVHPSMDARASWPYSKTGDAGQSRGGPRSAGQPINAQGSSQGAGKQAPPAPQEASSPPIASNSQGPADTATASANTAQPAQRQPASGQGQYDAPARRAIPQSGPAFEADDPDALPRLPLTPDARWEPSHIDRHARLVPAQGGAGQSGAGQSRAGRSAAISKTNVADTARSVRGPAAAHHSPGQSAEAEEPRASEFQDLHGSDIIDTPGWTGTSETTGDALRDAWSFRPSDSAQARVFAPGGDETAAGVRMPQLPPVRSVEADLELVQRKIKALADEVNANEAARNAAAHEHAHGAPVQNQTPAYHSAASLDDSVAALRTTADRMKQPKPALERAGGAVNGGHKHGAGMAPPTQSFDAQTRAAAKSGTQAPPQQPSAYQSGALPSLDALIPASAQPIAISRDEDTGSADERDEHRPLPQAAEQRSVQARQSGEEAKGRIGSPTPMPDRKLAEIAAAIESSRMDVFLKPIVGLGDYAVAHFEVDVRLKTVGGTYIDGAAETLSVGSSDLLALFDIERLSRTARVAEQLEARGKPGSLLSPTAGQSMTDGKFLEAFARTFEERTSISGQLVLTFTQADIAAFGPGIWQALADMNSFGFRFALSEVTHLATDFGALADRGFAFVKLPAEAFLDGMPAGHGMVPPADICRHMAGAGLTLVVESIDDQAQLAKVFGFGALFGQGQLFGGARQITLESLAERRTAAA